LGSFWVELWLSGRHRLWIFFQVTFRLHDRKTLDSTVLFYAIATEATSTTMKLTKLFAHLLSKLIKNKGFLHKILAEIQIKGPNLGIFGWRKPEGGPRFSKVGFCKKWSLLFIIPT